MYMYETNNTTNNNNNNTITNHNRDDNIGLRGGELELHPPEVYNIYIYIYIYIYIPGKHIYIYIFIPNRRILLPTELLYTLFIISLLILQ